MEVKKKKATGVLGEMIKNMDPESLERNRQKMVKTDELSKAYRKYREDCGVNDPVYLDEIEDAHFDGVEKGYEWAVSDVIEWLKSHVMDYIEIEWSLAGRTETSINWDELLNDLKNYMKVL